MEKINPYIFRAYDVRGVYPTMIDEDTAYLFGKAFGSYIQDLGKKKAVVGRDNRFSSISLSENLIKGITETGVDVVDLGLVTTPMYYYAWDVLAIPSGVMVTASHNPKDDNGFKFAFDERGNAKGEMIEAFHQFLLQGKFKKGKGRVTKYSIHDDYIHLFQNSLSFGDRPLKVVLDIGNGTTSIIAREIYSLFVPHLTVLFEESDPSFPNHHPDPSVEENLDVLKAKVLEEKADVGIAFDGDGDRVGVIDEKGNFVPCDMYMILIIRNLISKVSNKTFLYDVKCSKALEDEIVKLGGTPYCYKTGNSYTKSKTKELNLAFGGEYSGHVYFRDRFPGFDSGLYAGLRLLEILSKTDKSVSQLLEGVSFYYSTPEMKVPSLDGKKHQVVEKVQAYAAEKGYDVLTVDGVKVLFPNAFALIRVSNTGPNITVRFEAKTEERLYELQEEFMEQIQLYNT